MSEEASKLPKDIAAEEGKVNVQINGTWHRFPRGTRIADALSLIHILGRNEGGSGTSRPFL